MRSILTAALVFAGIVTVEARPMIAIAAIAAALVLTYGKASRTC